MAGKGIETRLWEVKEGARIVRSYSWKIEGQMWTQDILHPGNQVEKLQLNKLPGNNIWEYGIRDDKTQGNHAPNTVSW